MLRAETNRSPATLRQRTYGQITPHIPHRRANTSFIDLSALDERGSRGRLNLTLDDYGFGDPISIELGTTGNRPMPLKASVSTQRISVSLGRNEPRLREVDMVARSDEPARLWIAPRDISEPGKPTDHVTITTRQGTLKLAVWVEPATGMWSTRNQTNSQYTCAPADSVMTWFGNGDDTSQHIFPTNKAKELLVACVENGRAWMYSHRRNSRRAPRPIGVVEIPGGAVGDTATVALPRAAHSAGGSVLQWTSNSGTHILDIDSSSAGSWRKIEHASTHHPGSATLLADGGVLLSDNTHRWRLYQPENSRFTHVGDTELNLQGKPLLQRNGTVTTDTACYFPPYLWRGPRPVIRQVYHASKLRSGSEFTILVGGESLNPDVRVALLKLHTDGSPTYQWLPSSPPVASEKGPMITAGAVVPAGRYHLVILDKSYVPSHAVPVRVS